MKLEGITVNGTNVRNAIQTFYPNTFTTVEKNSLYGYLFLFGIRVNTCDTGIPDDIIGGMRYMPAIIGSDYWEIEVSDASTDPSPYYLKNYFNEQAKARGGTAWVKEGQHLYRLFGNWRGYPSFAPKDKVPVYRWNPRFEGDKFDPSKAVVSDSLDCLIHRSWAKDRFYKDSAGCQVLRNNESLKVLEKWAKNHLSYKNYPKNFIYTLLTKEQWVQGYERSKKPLFNYNWEDLLSF